MLTADGTESPYMAQSLQAATIPLALAAKLPQSATLAEERLDVAALTAAAPARLQALAGRMGAEVTLAGTLTWSDAARGWIADWRLIAAGSVFRWRKSGVSFDDAFRDAIRGAAQILSGNGTPR
ncbi:DUF2066 domain-containing protein [Sinorhizobium saheli]|nr:DUF2066 domain-containing protein [Sinorhizobium saheli]